MAIVVGPERNRGGAVWTGSEENETVVGRPFICQPSDQMGATILLSLGGLGIGANAALMLVILLRRPLRK